MAAAPAAKARYRATVRFTEHGIPHITAKDFGSLGFGSGYAAAEASICILADTVVTARGQRSRWFGPNKRYDDQVSMEGSNLQFDTLVADLHQRRVVEKLLKSKAGPGNRARQMVEGYTAGIDRWLRTNRVADPACRGAGYLRPNAPPDRPLVRRLPRQPARLDRRVGLGRDPSSTSASRAGTTWPAPR